MTADCIRQVVRERCKSLPTYLPGILLFGHHSSITRTLDILYLDLDITTAPCLELSLWGSIGSMPTAPQSRAARPPSSPWVPLPQRKNPEEAVWCVHLTSVVDKPPGPLSWTSNQNVHWLLLQIALHLVSKNIHQYSIVMRCNFLLASMKVTPLQITSLKQTPSSRDILYWLQKKYQHLSTKCMFCMHIYLY